ncbi:MAG: tetratricopeptide repeat protein [Phormidesmis sp.]
MQSPEMTSDSAAPYSVWAKTIPNRRFYRLDSWLSETDANFLLGKKALWEAKQDRYKAAIQLFDRLISLEPNVAKHYVNRGLTHARCKHWNKALADYNYAIEIDNTLDRAYSNRGNLYAERKAWAKAISDYDEAIDLNPLNTRARLNQAITFRKMGNHEEALDCLDIALFFCPGSAAIYAERGRTYHMRGDWNCAIADYRIALGLTKTDSNKASDIKVARRVKHWMTSLYR